MNIIVTMKQVPNPDTPAAQFKIDEAAKKLVPPPGVAPVPNGYDANALEAALQLREAHGGDVTVISLGPQAARETLKRAIAMGANNAILIDDPNLNEGDSWQTAYALAQAIKKVGDFDLILCGRQASDTDAGQVPMGIAEFLGLPGVTPVQKLEIDGRTARVERIVEDGAEVLEVQLPAVIAVSSEINTPRYPPLRGIMQAGRAQIPVWTGADLGLDPAKAAPKTSIRRLYVATREQRCEFIEADTPAEAGEKLALKLREAKLV